MEKIRLLLAEDHTIVRQGLRSLLEREVLQLIAEGKANKEIADLHFLSVKTVETHKAHLMAKLDIHTTADLIKYAIQKGIISTE